MAIILGRGASAAPPAQEFVGWRVRRTTNQVIPTGVDTPIEFDVARFDTHGFLAGTHIVIPAGMGGLYMMGATFRFSNTGTATVIASTIVLNAVIPEGELASQLWPGGANVHRIPTLSTLFEVEEGDFLDVNAYQNTAGNVNVDAIESYTPEFWGWRVAVL